MSERIAQKIAKHLSDAAPVGIDRRQGRKVLVNDFDLLIPSLRLNCAYRLSNLSIDSDRFLRQIQHAGFGEGKVLEVVDEPVQQHGLFMQRVDDSRLGPGQSVLQALQLAPNVGERCAQLMGDVRYHIAAKILGPNEL